MVEEPPGKREALERLLESGPAMIHLDPRREGVEAPADLRMGPVLRLKLSWHFAHPLHIDDRGISQTLTFPTGAALCAAPWEAVFAMGPAESQPSWIWAADLPPEMAELLASAAAGEPRPARRPPPAPRPAPALDRADPDPDDEGGAEAPPADPPGTIRRGHLRLVKG